MLKNYFALGVKLFDFNHYIYNYFYISKLINKNKN